MRHTQTLLSVFALYKPHFMQRSTEWINTRVVRGIDLLVTNLFRSACCFHPLSCHDRLSIVLYYCGFGLLIRHSTIYIMYSIMAICFDDPVVYTLMGLSRMYYTELLAVATLTHQPPFLLVLSLSLSRHTWLVLQGNGYLILGLWWHRCLVSTLGNCYPLSSECSFYACLHTVYKPNA
jgi:hypothetical protein